MHKGAFEPLVMYFSLCNLPATFQKMMNEIFHDMSDVCVVYIDDLMIFTKSDSQEEHDKIVLEVLRRLEANDLFVKPEKCHFCQGSTSSPSALMRRVLRGGMTVLEGAGILARGTGSCT